MLSTATTKVAILLSLCTIGFVLTADYSRGILDLPIIGGPLAQGQLKIVSGHKLRSRQAHELIARGSTNCNKAKLKCNNAVCRR